MLLLRIGSVYNEHIVVWISRKGVTLGNGKIIPLEVVEKNYGK
jgi:hypothetical protein